MPQAIVNRVQGESGALQMAQFRGADQWETWHSGKDRLIPPTSGAARRGAGQGVDASSPPRDKDGGVFNIYCHDRLLTYDRTIPVILPRK